MKTYGIINPETGEYGLRNEGIRAWDATAGKILFWEFDVFGGITSGEVNGELKKMRDSWTPSGKNSYKYKVVMQKNGEWSNILLSAEMKRPGE